jgi:hypothetical protein
MGGRAEAGRGVCTLRGQFFFFFCEDAAGTFSRGGWHGTMAARSGSPAAAASIHCEGGGEPNHRRSRTACDFALEVGDGEPGTPCERGRRSDRSE